MHRTSHEVRKYLSSKVRKPFLKQQKYLRDLNKKTTLEKADAFIEFLYKENFEIPTPTAQSFVSSEIIEEPLSYNWGAPQQVRREWIEDDRRRQVFVFQPEELDRMRIRSIYNRLEEAKLMIRTIPSLKISGFGIYPINETEEFDEFLPIYDDKDWQVRLKNDIIWDETDIFFANVPRLSSSHYLKLAWLLNEGYIPESAQIIHSLAFEELKAELEKIDANLGCPRC